MAKKLVYLATPYSHPDPRVRERRFAAVNVLTAKLMKEGQLVFSPISQSHPIAVAGGLPGDWAYWKEYDEAILAICKKLIVFCQEGWRDSVGVAAEIELAKETGIPVEYCYP